jgi:CRISPR-associated endonuclease/helicase Cas3
MRGQEREQLLASDAVFARFMPESSRPAAAERVVGTAYLVCTSAGEVGVDISADHMVCDLSTFDSMAQRFGRVNRYGRFDDTRIDVVHPKEFGKKQKGSEERKLTEMDERRRSTLDLLKQLKGDASPLALSGLNAEARLSAFAPPPTIPPATDILFDAWAMTTIRGDMPGRPPVAPYLHGLAEWEPPRTKVAWREEVDAVTPELLQYFGEEFPRSLLDDYPLKPHELLSDTSERVLRKLQQLAAEHPHARAWLIDGQGEAMVCELACIATPDATKKKDREPLLRTIGEATVLLPPSIGGLTAQGTLDGKTPPEEGPSAGLDVADLWIGEEGKPRRKRMFSEASQPRGTPEAMTLIRTIDVNPLAEEFATREEAEQPAGLEAEDQAEHEATAESRRYWHWFARPRGAENATKASPKPVVWREHIDDVAGWAERITERLGLAEHLKQTLVLAARWHDLGKKRELWQRSIGNPDPTQWHAKGGKPRGETPWRPRRFGEYRHEFGSLLDATDSNQAFAEELRLLSEETRDIVLHLIAAHHGYARPHFPPEATVDPNHPQSASDAAALEVPRRYARLQRRFGRWGLAYLESLLRAADWAASANPAASSAAGEGDEQ